MQPETARTGTIRSSAARIVTRSESRASSAAWRATLGLVILFAVAFGVLYAIRVPRWQAPDEPAHYNYVRQIAETGSLPTLQPGDYDQAYLEKIKALRFPADMPVDAIRYESYQPPLYYLSAVPIYLAARALGGDTLLALRLYSVLLCAVLLLLAVRVLRVVFKGRPILALAGVGFIAVLPMHIAMSAAANADPLAEVIVAALFLISLARLQDRLSDRSFQVLGGVVYGLALLTSTKIYAGVILLFLAEILRAGPFSLRARLRVLLPLVAVALLISSWWFARNALVYGGLDILGWGRHDQVVIGQPTTVEWIARYGLRNTVADFFIISFKSFWALFGWMGVLVNDRIYVGLFLLTAAVSLGALLAGGYTVSRWRRHLDASAGVWVLVLSWLVVVLLSHVYYNLRFVQPQGRYLFTALIPIAAIGVAGLYEIVDKRYARLTFALIYAALLALDLISLYWYILPQLAS